MALPVTGPIVKSVTQPQTLFYQERYRQRRPYNLDLKYRLDSVKAASFSFPTNPSYPLAANADAAIRGNILLQRAIDQAKSAAYERLKGAISDRASMGENLGQLGSSVRLIQEKAKIVADSVKRLRRFDVRAFADWFERGFVKRNSRFASQLTLEINFAIAPSINDIYTSIEILQNPIKSPLVRGRSTVPFRDQYQTNSAFSKTWVAYGPVSAEYGARVAISNPNLYLANTLGLINPVQTAWQLLPGSFLVDWLIPVEQFLGTATDFLGLTVERAYSTWFARGSYSEFWNTYGWKGSTSFAYVERVPGISLPSLALRPLKMPSLRRAANAVSLAIQAFYR